MRTACRPSLAVAALLAAVCLAVTATQSGAQVSRPGTEPTQWGVTGSAPDRFGFTVDTTVVRTGRASLRIATQEEPGGFGSLVTALPAAPYAGRTVQLALHIRTEGLQAPGAAVWLRADRASGPGGFATTQGRLALGGTTDWREVKLDLDVPHDATRLVFGALSTAEGQVWIDDITLATLDSARIVVATRALGFEPTDALNAPAPTVAATLQPSPREAPRPVTQRGLDNLEAFTRLVGYVRFFYPGDRALGVNWDEFTVRGMRLVEAAPSPDSLASTLRAMFAPVAPEVAVYRTGSTPPPATHDAEAPTAVLFWQHLGYGTPPAGGAQRRSIYSSMRRSVPLERGVRPDSIRLLVATTSYLPVPDPARPFTADLGGGVSVRVPLALLATGSSGDTPVRPAAATEASSVADRATRLATVALLWMVPQHFYPYFDVVGREWERALRPTLAEAATISTAAAFDTTLQRLVATLDDGHGRVYRAGASSAVPDVRLDVVEGRIVVTSVGDSAAAAGVARGDELVALDGRPAMDVLRERESLVSGATPQYIRHVGLVSVAAGAPGTTTTLTLRAASGAERDVRLTRRGTLPARTSLEPIAELRPGVWYVDLDRVTDAALDSAMPALAQARGVVFDMRGYPNRVNTIPLLGTLTDSVVRSPHFQVPVVVAPDARDMRFTSDGWLVPPRQPRIRGRIAFLSGGGAISYAESTLGVVEDNALAPIVGEPSAGTNGNINRIALPGNYTFVFTGMRVLKQDGTPHHGVGIRPTVPVLRTLADVRAGRDPVLERALDIVSQER